MSRPRKSDHATAVEAAKVAFMQNGFAGTSTRKIEECSGLTRFTLQTNYGGKLPFFLEVLDAYLDSAEAHFLPDPAKTDLEGLALWFERLSAPGAMPKMGDKGCMVLNTIDEFKRDGGEIDQRIDRYFAALESRFSQIIVNAVDQKVVAGDTDPDEQARLLISLLLGISTAIRARSSDGAACAYTSATAAMIRGWQA
jgi:TetR/AcrR family transcriptional repressor of nem operon